MGLGGLGESWVGRVWEGGGGLGEGKVVGMGEMGTGVVVVTGREEEKERGLEMEVMGMVGLGGMVGEQTGT